MVYGMSPLDPDPWSSTVIGPAIAVHRRLGPAVFENVYHACLAYEIRRAGLRVESNVPLPVRYDELVFQLGYRLDLLVENSLVVELKAVTTVLEVHHTQVNTYLKLSGCPVGLLINFKVPILKDRITRFVNSAGARISDERKQT